MNNTLLKSWPMVVFWLGLFLLPPASLWARDTLTSSIVDSSDEFFLDILQPIAKKLDLELQIRTANFARSLLLMQEGSDDIMIEVLKSPEREAYLHYIEPPYIRYWSLVFVVPKGKHSSIQHYEDLYGLRIGTNMGWKYSPRFDEDTRIQKYPVSSVQQNIRKLLLGRIDAFTGTEVDELINNVELGFNDKMEFADYRHRMEAPVYIAISKKSPLMARLDEVEPILQRMVESGEIRTIIEQYSIRLNLPIPDYW